jgi:4-diphosphocytidyl-2-C-methyl-D-erythritol kinase
MAGDAPGVTISAPAKVNLALHVTGRRADGYHLLDTLVAFAGVGDTLTLRRAAEPALVVSGPEAAGVPAGAENLVARAIAAAPLPDGGAVAAHLVKRLPAASGIGGGSADAAAALRGMQALGAAPPSPGTVAALGADVPMCLAGHPLRARGIGEETAAVPGLPQMAAVLVNPRMPVATPAVFAALDCRENAPMPEALPRWPDARALAAWLETQRNDLETPARAVAPVIGAVLDALGAQAGCLLARMSGSGATCFGLFGDDAAAEATAARLAAACPGWWVVPTVLGAPEIGARPLPAAAASGPAR